MNILISLLKQIITIELCLVTLKKANICSVLLPCTQHFQVVFPGDPGALAAVLREKDEAEQAPGAPGHTSALL